MTLNREDVLPHLIDAAGVYEGEGRNHDGQEFLGVLVLEPILGDEGLVLRYIAASVVDDEVYHEEHSVLADGPEGLGLWSFNTNTKLSVLSVAEVKGVDGAAKVYEFGLGDLEDRSGFRERIRLQLWEDGEVSYDYSWGEPGEDFGPRSSVRMQLMNELDEDD